MFGASNPFGQSSGSPFGQTSNAANNPFAPKPFGTTTPFSSPQTGSSIFGSTATGMFGAPQNSSPFPSTSAFGASSSPAFGASSAPSFGCSSAPFGVFGQKPTFGGFGSTSQANPFGSTSQPSQPAFGTSVIGSTTPFGASSQPAFGSSSTPSFGSTSTATFGSTSTATFGSTSMPTFGSTSTPAFGSTITPAFGSTSTPSFGTSRPPAFGATSAPAFGSSPSPAFGSTGAFGVSSSPMFGSGGDFGSSGTSAFGAPSTPAFSLGYSPGYGQSASAFGSSPLASTPSSFGAQTSSFGRQPTTPTFASTSLGQPSFGAQHGGSRVTSYAAASETETVGGQPVKLYSISAMPAYKDTSHEELRWEDYQLGDRGGQPSASQSLGGIGFGASTVQPNPFSSSTFTQTSAGLFSSNTSTNLFESKPSAFGPSTTPAFASTFSSSPNLFQSTSTSTSLFGAPTSSQSLFGSSASTGFGSTPSLFASTGLRTGSSFASGLNFSNTQPSSFQTTTFMTGGSSFVISSPIGVTSTFGQPNPFGNSTSVGFTAPNLSSSTLPNISSTNLGMFGQTNPSQSMLFQSPQPSQTSTALNISSIGQTQAGGSSLFSGTSNMFSQNNLGQWPTTSSAVPAQLVPITNPFGMLPTMPQISIDRAGTTSSIQYGISSMPVVDKPAPVRTSSLLISRHLSQRRIRLLPARKYQPKHGGPKVPFFSEEEESTPKDDALFIPRENPRALVISPMGHWPSKATVDKASLPKDASTFSPVHENENTVEDGLLKDEVYHVKLSQRPNGFHDNNLVEIEESYLTLSGNRAGETAITYQHGDDIEASMPKLSSSDYYTEPCVAELEAKERAEPGFCCHVRDFVVGRHGYGSIKLFGETDVGRLDLESIVQFNNREVIVYMDDRKKPPVGQGLNKPAEVTLLNIKCFDRKSGGQFTHGPKIEKYKEMLKRKAEDQGAEFVSYDPIKGEWKFRVKHFSMYGLGEE